MVHNQHILILLEAADLPLTANTVAEVVVRLEGALILFGSGTCNSD